MDKALFIRLDRMGDLVLTLPCDHLVSDQYEVHWLVPKAFRFVTDHTKPSRRVHFSVKPFSWKAFKEVYQLIKELRPQVSVSFHVPWWVNAALFLARVPVRGGVLSQWHSHLFLNKGLRQKRSRCEYHEMEYNYLLVEHTFQRSSESSQWKPLALEAPTGTNNPMETSEDYVVVHPGMGGSALNWPTEHYATLINQLSEKIKVVITGTANDEPYLTPLKEKLKENHSVVWLDQQLNGEQLLKLLSQAKATVAPSTGVIHLSASLGVASFGIYSPIKVHRAKRWGPKGHKVVTFEPQQPRTTPHGSEKEVYEAQCMTKLAPAPVAEAVINSLH